MGWLADLLKEIPSAARYKAELEQLTSEHAALKEENTKLKAALEAICELNHDLLRPEDEPSPRRRRRRPAP